jgi:predicted adenine nucleotide alpha hydrolase (AANH) superfamily ATPase
MLKSEGILKQEYTTCKFAMNKNKLEHHSTTQNTFIFKNKIKRKKGKSLPLFDFLSNVIHLWMTA